MCDHNNLRTDPAFQTIVSHEKDLASASTLSRFENAVTSDDCLKMSIGLVEHFISQHKSAPEDLVLDFDPTDYRYLPLYVFCGKHLLVSYLRPNGIDGALHAGAILKVLVKRFRQVGPNVRSKVRGDSACARRHILHWCDNSNLGIN